MTIPRPHADARRGRRRAAPARFTEKRLAVCVLVAANLIVGASMAERLADFRLGHDDNSTGGLSIGAAGALLAENAGGSGNFNGNGNIGSFNGNGNAGNFNGNGNLGSSNGNGNAGSFNGNARCGDGFGNGSASDGDGKRDIPAWCRYLKNLNSQLGLPPGVVPDFD